MLKSFIFKYWKDLLLGLFIIIITIGVYEKFNNDNIINSLNDSLIQLESDKRRITEQFESIRNDFIEARLRITEYKNIEQELESRIRELEGTIGEFTHYTDSIGASEQRARQYNREAREIIQDLRERITKND